MMSMSRAFPKLILVVPLLLSACQTPIAVPPAKSPPRMPATRGAEPEASPAQPTAPAAPPSVAELAADPQRFKGLSVADVTGLLGKPSFQRRDADAEIWQYYGPSSACVLDLFVYPEQGAMRVAHAELRSRNATASAASACLGQILDGRRG